MLSPTVEAEMIKRSLSVLLIASLTVIPFAGLTFAGEYNKITGPKTFFIQPAGNTYVTTVDGETEIHLPSTAKTVFVEEYQPATGNLEKEVRAYTVQQTVYWIVATAILIYTRLHT